jgi:hypothetical protein
VIVGMVFALDDIASSIEIGKDFSFGLSDFFIELSEEWSKR